MNKKTSVVQRDAWDKIKSAVNKTVDLIKPTFGPTGNKVIISKVTHAMVVDDGVQIARDLELADPIEHAIMKIVREVAIKTNDRIGDGTTGALILLQAIINRIDKLRHRNGRLIEKELKKSLEDCKTQLKNSTKKIETVEDLYKVALVSFDDEKIAKLISDAWFKLGAEGVLTVDRSGTMDTYTELTDGIKIDRGYISPYMVTNIQRMEALIEKPYILFTDYRLTEANDVIHIMDKLLKEKITSLVIVAENVEQGALATLIVNKNNGVFNTVAINAPSGDNRSLMLEDMALMTGGKVISEKKGDKLEDVEIADLGRATRFIAKRADSVIIGPKIDKEKLELSIKDLQIALETETKESDKEELKRRIARFSNKIGVIKVGAPTENEMYALKYKVEDCVNATQAAFKGGVVKGGGLSLVNLITESKIMNEALKVPFYQLKLNVGYGKHRKLEENEAINVVTGEIGPWQEVGVMDPVDVIIAQLESAVSIAVLLVTTSGMVIEDPEYLKRE
jgi:chaperonin GroEL